MNVGVRWARVVKEVFGDVASVTSVGWMDVGCGSDYCEVVFGFGELILSEVSVDAAQGDGGVVREGEDGCEGCFVVDGCGICCECMVCGSC